mmetsp:Transcript_65402/g.128601  ORF Transcript_65402/g.128601 Transcript_65402/m.128601 type:complete len:229 (-) Transcript_65402:55-741(-)
MFKDFKSLCTTGGVRLCRNATPSDTCKAIVACWLCVSGVFALCNKWCNDPPAMNSVTMHKFGGFRHAAMNRTRLGWFKLLSAATSFSNSSNWRGEMLPPSSQNSFLIATSCPRQNPLYTAPNPPVPRHSFCSKSASSTCSCCSKRRGPPSCTAGAVEEELGCAAAPIVGNGGSTAAHRRRSGGDGGFDGVGAADGDAAGAADHCRRSPGSSAWSNVVECALDTAVDRG